MNWSGNHSAPPHKARTGIGTKKESILIISFFINENGAIIYPGAPPVSVQQKHHRQSSFLLGHFGSLGGVRNLSRFIGGVELAIRSPHTSRCSSN